jgi:CRP/FNR family cyclic AMP-dependent transcriptional regulator
MNIWIEIAGYVASALVGASFYMKTIIPLRLFAITSNVAFIIYGIGAGLYPVIILHIFLFPLNILRLLQMKKLISNVKEASDGNFSLESLIPYMVLEDIKKGDIIFKKGDLAEKMYYLCKGKIELVNNGLILEKGHILGEMGIFSPLNKRTDTAICIDDNMKLYSITEKGVKELYYQNPEFGFYLVKLITSRFITGIEKDKILAPAV